MDMSQYKVLEFEIPAADFDPNFTPEDGIQYLQQVFHERQRCPAVVTKPLGATNTIASGSAAASTLTAPEMPTPEWSNLHPNQPAPAPAATSCAELPDIHRPTDEWRHIQYTEFTKMRDYVGQTRLRFGAPAAMPAQPAHPIVPSAIEDSRGWRLFMLDNQPFLNTLLRLQQPELEQLLDYQLEWLVRGGLAEYDDDDDADADDEEVAAADDGGSGGRFVTVATATSGSPETRARWDLGRLAAVGRWIYSLMTCLHLPLEPSVHAQLRDVARQALHIRNRLPAGDSGAQMAAPLNLIACIIVRNFGQADLAERV